MYILFIYFYTGNRNAIRSCHFNYDVHFFFLSKKPIESVDRNPLGEPLRGIRSFISVSPIQSTINVRYIKNDVRLTTSFSVVYHVRK